MIESSGSDLLTNLSGIQSGSAFIALTKLSGLLQVNGGIKSETDVFLLNNLKAFSQGELKEGFDMSSVSTYIAEYAGVYTFDESTETFSKTEASNKVEFSFPYDANSTCTFIVTAGFGSDQNVPNSVSSTMKINNLQVLNLSLRAEFSENYLPTLIAEAMTIDDFTMGMDFTRSNAKAGISYFINKGTTTLIKYSTDVEGDLSDNTLVTAFTNASQEPTDVEQTEESDIEELENFSNIASKIAFSAQVMDVKIVASADTKNAIEVAKQASQYEDNGVPPSKAQMDEICGDMNSMISCYVMQVSQNAKIANIKFYSTLTEEESVSYYQPEPMFEFGDNTTSTFDAYFATDEFTSLSEQFEAIVGPYVNSNKD